MPLIRKTVQNPRLFTDEDPLEIEIPGAGKIRLSDFSVNPPPEDEVSPETAPLTYLVEYISRAIHPDTEKEEVDRVREALLAGVSNNTITVSWLGEVVSEITSMYGDAFEAAIAESSGRPTRRRGR